jgi:hypothetical protein
MKKIDFIFEEFFREGKSRRKIITLDIDDIKNWKGILNYEKLPDSENSNNKYNEKQISNDPKVWLKIIECCTDEIWDGTSTDGFDGWSAKSSVEGDEPDDYYYDNGPEDTKYYFNLAK